MAKFEAVLFSDDNYHDILIEVSFKNEVSSENILEIITLITETVTGYEAKNLDFELLGISSLQIDSQKLEIQLRFTLNPKSEEISHQKANFAMHLIAKVDAQHPLEKTWFLASTKHLLNLREYYGLDDEKENG